MRKISNLHKAIIDSSPYYKKCARRYDSGCGGRITIEHALVFGGRQIAELWNYVPLCEYHHGVLNYQDCGDLQKEKNVWIALNQATDEELKKYSKVVPYIRERDRLNVKYGKYNIKG
jgi:hypothetical protein